MIIMRVVVASVMFLLTGEYEVSKNPRRKVVRRFIRRLVVECLENRHLLSGPEVAFSEIPVEPTSAPYVLEKVSGSGVRQIDFQTYSMRSEVIPPGRGFSPREDSAERTLGVNVVSRVRGIAFGLNFQVFTETWNETVGAHQEEDTGSEFAGDLDRGMASLAFNGQWFIAVLNFDMSVTITATDVSEQDWGESGGAYVIQQTETLLQAGVSGKMIVRGRGASGGVNVSASLADLWYDEVIHESAVSADYIEQMSHVNVAINAPSFFLYADGFASVVVNSIIINGDNVELVKDFTAMGAFDINANGAHGQYFSASADAERILIDAVSDDGKKDVKSDRLKAHGSVYTTSPFLVHSGTVMAGTLVGSDDDFGTLRLRPRGGGLRSVDNVFSLNDSGDEDDQFYLRLRGYSCLAKIMEIM